MKLRIFDEIGFMASKRRYPPRDCKNPDCRKSFIPTDKRQVYCERQCQINYNNDLKNTKAVDDRYATLVKKTDEILEHFYIYADGKKGASFHKRLLSMAKVNFEVGDLEKIPGTNTRIRWYVLFGLQQVNEKEYFIISREKYESDCPICSREG